jgi:HSP20 family molecular chaperone IbpA
VIWSWNLSEDSNMNANNISDKRTLLMTSLVAVPACQMRDGDTDWFPAVDLAETGQEYVFEVDLPGLMPEEIQLEVDNAAISISGKRMPRSQGGQWLRVERPSGAFIRQLPLPPNTTGEIYGSFADGVLELRVPKARQGSKTRPTQAVARELEEVVP